MAFDVPFQSENRAWLWATVRRYVQGGLPTLHYVPHTLDQFDSVARATPAAMVGYAVNTLIAVVALRQVASTPILALWAIIAWAIAAIVLLRLLRPSKRNFSKLSSTEEICRKRERRSVIFGVLLAAPWTCLVVLYLGRVPQPSETIVISLAVGMAASGAVLLAPIERAAVAYMSTILLPAIAVCFVGLDIGHYGLLGALAVSFWVFLLALIGTTNQLYRTKSQVVDRLMEALQETRSAHEKFQHLATHDALTELANRRAFLHRLNSAIMQSQGTGCASWVLLLLDLDRFKVVNDTLGHKFGDELLRLVAERLKQCVRPGDLVARLGGDEFAIIAEDVYDTGEAEQIAERLLEDLLKPFSIQNRTVTVGVSIGIAAPLSSETDSEQLMRCADLAMYEAKAAGRNRFKVFELDMQDRMDARSIVEMGLRAAIVKGEMELHFQPIYELATLRLARFEALIRWRHPTKGLLAPAEFLPIAEEIGLINEIGEWVVREACLCAIDWPAHVGVAVNLSPLQVNAAGVVELVERTLKVTGLDPARLELEITETALLSDTAQTKQTLERLKDLGVVLSMDDFGTGYSSLSYLATFPLDGIKIDKGFIARFAMRNENAEIMRAMLELAKALNRTSTVEGIETFAHLNAAQALGATYGQGYYFGRPQPDAQARALMMARAKPSPVLLTG